MKQAINFNGFCDAFRDAGRNEQFSYEGKKALYEYLEQYEEETGQEIELDVIALCCEYSEEPLQDVLDNYNLASLEKLQDNTQVIPVDDETIIYLQF
jgi:hypothetical protein